MPDNSRVIRDDTGKFGEKIPDGVTWNASSAAQALAATPREWFDLWSPPSSPLSDPQNDDNDCQANEPESQEEKRVLEQVRDEVSQRCLRGIPGTDAEYSSSKTL